MTHPISQENTITGHFTKATLCAGIGALAAHVFTTIHPLGGALFGTSCYFIHSAMIWTYDQMGASPTPAMIRITTLYASIAASSVLTTACGVPMSFTAAVFLSGGMLITATAITVAVASCLFFSMFASGIYLSQRPAENI